MSSPASSSRRFDLVLFGATGFAGQLAARYLAGRVVPGELRIALAGRSPAKLERVLAELPGAPDWGVIEADSSNAASLAALARSTRVVATTVGPFARYGLPLISACVDAGTDYADITGEILFMRQAIDRFHGRAQRTGARIVQACGFDSTPSDLGVLVLHRYADQVGAGQLLDTRLAAKLSGGLSGGTIETMREQLAAARGDAWARAVLLDPYALSPDRAGEFDLGPQPDVLPVSRVPGTGEYLAPFAMGPGNARVVRRSNALQGHVYGKAFRYHEYMNLGAGYRGAVAAHVVHRGTGLVTAALGHRPTAALLGRVLPKPGEGPSEAARENGSYRIDISAHTTEGLVVGCRVEADGDPGYKSNATLISEAALCLALDSDETPNVAGVLTPATALGETLVDRLRAAGHKFEPYAVR